MSTSDPHHQALSGHHPTSSNSKSSHAGSKQATAPHSQSHRYSQQQQHHHQQQQQQASHHRQYPPPNQPHVPYGTAGTNSHPSHSAYGVHKTSGHGGSNPSNAQGTNSVTGPPPPPPPPPGYQYHHQRYPAGAPNDVVYKRAAEASNSVGSQGHRHPPGGYADHGRYPPPHMSLGHKSSGGRPGTHGQEKAGVYHSSGRKPEPIPPGDKTGYGKGSSEENIPRGEDVMLAHELRSLKEHLQRLTDDNQVTFFSGDVRDFFPKPLLKFAKALDSTIYFWYLIYTLVELSMEIFVYSTYRGKKKKELTLFLIN